MGTEQSSHCTRSLSPQGELVTSRDKQVDSNNVQKFCKPSSAYFQLLHINSPVNTYFNPSGVSIKLGDNPGWLDLQTYYPSRNSVSMEPSNVGKQLRTKLKIRNLNEDQAFFSGWTDRSYLTVCLRDRERLILEEGELFYLLTY